MERWEKILNDGWTGLLAGAVAGLGVALVDSLRLWMLGGVDWSLPGYAALLYVPLVGMAGVVAVIKLRWLLPLVGRKAPSPLMAGLVSSAALFGLCVLAIGFFYLFRDVFEEKFPVTSLRMLGSMAVLFLILSAFGAGGTLGLKKILSGTVGARLNRKQGSVALTAIVAVLAIVSLASGGPAAGDPLRAAPATRRPNIILVMNDTHRADYTGVYGGPKDLTPRLDAFAGDGVVYNGFANASWTRPSVTTILTGRYASSHTAMFKGSILPDEVTTLAEVLNGGGYETIGIATNYNLTPFFNVDQGFSDYEYLPPRLPFGASDEQSKLIFIEVVKKIAARLQGGREVPEDYYVVGEKVTDRALQKIDGRDTKRPFFLFLSYMDVHDPYFRHPYDGHAISHRANPDPDPADKALIAEMKELYKGEIRYWDKHFGRLVDGLKQRGLYDDTMVVVLSDHGEEFGEHGGFWHGTTLYDEQLKIIFVVKYAASSLFASAAGQKVDSWHSLVDVAPMIIEQAGLDIPSEMQGVAQHAGERDSVFAEEDHQGNILTSTRYAAKDGALRKVIAANEGNPRGLPTLELFDVSADPLEQKNLSGERTMVPEALEQLTDGQRKARRGRAAAAQGELTGEMKSQLDALGYMEDEK